MMEPTCNVERAAEIMNVHENTVRALIDDLKIPAAKLGRGWVMLTQDVLRYVTDEIQQQTAKRTQEKLGAPITKVSRPG